MITQLSTSLYEQCLAEFEVRTSLGATKEPAEIGKLRSDAIGRFRKLGFPSTRAEDWKYTNLAPFLKEEFYLEQEDSLLSVDEKWLRQARIPGLSAKTIVTVNGQFRPDLSDSVPGSDLLLLPLASAITEPAFREHFGKHVDFSDKHFVALNTALFRNGLYIEVKAKAQALPPIHIIHVYSADSPLLLQPRNLVVAGNQSSVMLLESYLTLPGSAPVLINEVAEIVVGENSNFAHYYMQEGNESTRLIQHTEICQKPSSIYNNYKASFPGAALLRNNTHVVLDGKNIESHLYGIYLCAGKQVADNHTLVDHRMPNCQSNELYKGVMDDEASGIFNGKIYVRQDAQKTNAFQQNNNLMLSDKAVVDSKPQLEIFADDVKCSHGSTVGQFDEEALFYLQTRGIGRETARALLVHAFLFDVTERIPIPAIRNHINQLIEEGLGREHEV